MTREIDLSLPESINDLGYRIDFHQSISLGQGGTVWTATISRRGWTKAGNEAKPVRVITLIHEDPIALLHQVAELFEEATNGPVPVSDGSSNGEAAPE